MIKGFADDETERLFHRERPRGFPDDVLRPALQKLVMLEAAETLSDLRAPPGNRLKKLERDRQGQYSIRINDQWRVCFSWHDGHAYDVEITDYHD